MKDLKFIPVDWRKVLSSFFSKGEDSPEIHCIFFLFNIHGSIKEKLEKVTREFLWEGLRRECGSHLVNCNMVSKPNKWFEDREYLVNWNVVSKPNKEVI